MEANDRMWSFLYPKKQMMVGFWNVRAMELDRAWVKDATERGSQEKWVDLEQPGVDWLKRRGEDLGWKSWEEAPEVAANLEEWKTLSEAQ